MKYLFLILLICISTYTYSIDLSLINLSSINGINEVEEDMLFIINDGKHLDNYIPDEYWNFKNTKQEYTNTLVSIIESLQKFEQDKNNQNYYLLLGLLHFYLYNLDYPESYEKIMINLDTISNFGQKDYRYKWFSGIINAKAAKAYLAIRDFEYITDQVPKESLHPLFWNDYAFAAFLAFMPERSMEYMENYAEYGNKDLSNISMYQAILDSFVEKQVDNLIDYKDLYQLFKREYGLGFISYPFGIWIPTQGEWNVRQLNYKDRFSAIVFGSQKIDDGNGNNITYSIGTYIYVDDDKDHIKQQLDMYSEKIETTLPGISDIFTVYEVWDPDLYNQIGGAHGYVAFYKNEPGKVTNLEIEQASKIELGVTNGASYVPLSKKIRKISDNITYIFLLDSCENIHEQSKKDFVDFISNVLIE